jgi:peptidoglycan/LPS O-acetylase OafA/YrhL
MGANSNGRPASLPYARHCSWLREKDPNDVVLHHARIFGAPMWFRWIFMRGFFGVDFFFVLSGWLIGGQLFRSMRAGELDLIRFWIRRWLRTLPTYYVMLAVHLVLENVQSPHHAAHQTGESIVSPQAGQLADT